MVSALLALNLLQVVEHPVDAFRLIPDAPVQHVDIRGSPEGPLPPSLAGLMAGEPVAVLGGWASRCDAFEDIIDVAVAPNGTVFVLTRGDVMVRQFDPSNTTCPRAFGRRGEGPGRLRAPRELLADDAGKLHVLDLDGSIEVYSTPTGGRNFVPERTIVTGINAASFCVTETGYVIHGHRTDGEDGLLHVVGPNGSIRQSFGRIYGDPSTRVSYLVAQGRISCEGETATAHAPSSVLGEVRGFGADGAVQWLVRLGNHSPLTLIANGDELTALGPTMGYDRVTSLTRTPEGHLLLQVTHLSLPVGSTFIAPQSTHSVLIDPVSGSGRALGTEIPLVLTWGVDHAVTLYDSFERSLAVLPIH